jgi:hypothetical protein
MDSHENRPQSTPREPYRFGHDSYNYGCMDNFADWFHYAEGYKQAGDVLIEWVERQKGLADSVIHPLCFLYRHYLELTLKSIIVDCQAWLGKSGKLPLSHEIQDLWKICRALLEEIYGEDFLGDKSAIEEKINTFIRIAPPHDAFRYPISKKGKLSFPEAHYVNVRVLGEEIHEIWKFFFGISNDVAEKLKTIL